MPAPVCRKCLDDVRMDQIGADFLRCPECGDARCVDYQDILRIRGESK
jgi:predicted RNA-binding Zn-ribbon protein involved in translation (DUF1610 family)